MIRIAIVGEIGCGKTHLSNLLGFPVFNADQEVKKIYNNDKKINLKLKKELPNFIKKFPTEKEQIFKAILKNKKNLKKITKIVHPAVRKKMLKFIKKNSKKKAIVLDIPLYFENKIYKKNDYVIYVYAKKSKIIERLKLRKGFNIQIYNNLKKIQLSNEYKKNRSKLIIKNNFNKKSLKKVIFMIKREIFLK